MTKLTYKPRVFANEVKQSPESHINDFWLWGSLRKLAKTGLFMATCHKYCEAIPRAPNCFYAVLENSSLRSP